MVEHARAVIIGGGVGGTSIAYHLSALGWTDIILVDRAELTSGSTFHSAGLVGQLRSTATLTRMMMYGSDALPQPARRDRGRPVVARGRFAPARLDPGAVRGAAQRQAGWAKTFGLPLELSPPPRPRSCFPLMSTDGVLGGVYLPTDGWLDPSGLAHVARRRRPKRGAAIRTHTRVVGIETAATAG